MGDKSLSDVQKAKDFFGDFDFCLVHDPDTSLDFSLLDFFEEPDPEFEMRINTNQTFKFNASDNVKVNIFHNNDNINDFAQIHAKRFHRSLEEVAKLFKDIPNSSFIVAYINDVPVGTIHLCFDKENIGGMYGIYVKEEFINQGVGEAMINTAVNEARTKVCEWLYGDAYGPTIQLLTNLGFEKVKRWDCYTIKQEEKKTAAQS